MSCPRRLDPHQDPHGLTIGNYPDINQDSHITIAPESVTKEAPTKKPATL
jgi:hypothetical protein